jgi:heme oxygenase
LDDGRGVSVYVFNSISDRTKEASVGEMKKIKEWFREGMNLGAGDDERVKGMLSP